MPILLFGRKFFLKPLLGAKPDTAPVIFLGQQCISNYAYHHVLFVCIDWIDFKTPPGG